MPFTWDDMFNWVSEIVDVNNLDDSDSVNMTDGRLHIRFDSDIMFAGDSADILPSGRRALNLVAPGIQAMNLFIENVEVQGHTAPNPITGGRNAVGDTGLSAARAVNVHNHLDLNLSMVDENKFKSTGCGPWNPHYLPITNPEINARNRRVELIITRNDYSPDGTQTMIDMLKHDYKLGPIPGSQLSERKPTPVELNKVRHVEEQIREKYDKARDSASFNPIDKTTSEFGPAIPKLPTVDSFDSADGGGAPVAPEGDGGNAEAGE